MHYQRNENNIPIGKLYDMHIIQTELRHSIDTITYAGLLKARFGGTIFRTNDGFVLPTANKVTFEETKHLIATYKGMSLFRKLYFYMKFRLEYPSLQNEGLF